MEFTESGLQFEFEDDSCYRIELSQAAEALGEGIKKAECLCVQEDTLWVLEAKSSIPQERKDKKRYEEWWQDIYDKLHNSLQLTVLGLAGRHALIGAELPEKFKSSDLSQLNIKLVLVIPAMPAEHAMIMTSKLQSFFDPLFKKLWQIKSNAIFVMNEDQARRYSLCR